MSDYSGERKVRIEDDWFTDNVGETFAVEPLTKGGPISHSKENFRPEGIMINSNSDDSDAVTATVWGYLHNENETDMDDYILALNVVHPLAFKAVRNQGTTARGIKIIG